uniref:oxaloacetate tautomerase FAHD1, mitochondrial n=1 Tax=Myxine glutinosa TaxID=7769 RepID=UPI00358E7400
MNSQMYEPFAYLRDHAKELNNPLPSEPVLFLKPTSSYLREGHPIEIPWYSHNLHHEVELGLVLGQGGRCIPTADAMDFIGGYALCLDMTARDTQDACKEKGLPWTLAKAFDGSCPIGEYIPKEKIPEPQSLCIWLKVNGVLRQDGNTSDMIFSIPSLINYISNIMTLEEGDLILTGTPAGVAAVHEGDIIEAGLGNISTMNFTITRSSAKP